MLDNMFGLVDRKSQSDSKAREGECLQSTRFSINRKLFYIHHFVTDSDSMAKIRNLVCCSMKLYYSLVKLNLILTKSMSYRTAL